MRSRLWPHADFAELHREVDAFVTAKVTESILSAAFVADDDAAQAIGFIELSLRAFSDGCASSPVPHIEGWYVEPEARRQGVGHALIAAAEAWAREGGFTELASDVELYNDASLRAHGACGFDEVERLIKLRKALA